MFELYNSSINQDIQEEYLQNFPDDEVPKQLNQTYQLNNPIDIKYGYQDDKSLLFSIQKNLPIQYDFKIGVDLIYLVDLSSLNDENMEKIKKALKCLVNQLSDQDRFCIVIYADKADKLFPLIPLNQANKQKIIEKIEQLTVKRGHSNFLNALLVANLCLKLRQFKNQITSLNIISQNIDIQRHCQSSKNIFQEETSFKLNAFLLLQNWQAQSHQRIQKKSENFKTISIVTNIDQLASLMCSKIYKLQTTIIQKLQVVIKIHKKNRFQISECEGGKLHYINPHEIQIQKNFLSMGYDKTHIICIENGTKFENGQICDIEVIFQQISSNHKQKYTIPIFLNTQQIGIVDEAIMVQKYKFKSRSKMIEALEYYDPYRIQDCTEILNSFKLEIADLPDGIKQQLNVETQQFEIALKQYSQDPSQQIQNPFLNIDNLIKKEQGKPF